jgi:hypothetical protein
MLDDTGSELRLRKWWWLPVLVISSLLIALVLVGIALYLLSPQRYNVFVDLPDGCLLVGAPVSESTNSAFITLPAGEQEVVVDCQGRVYKVKLFIRQVSVNGADWKLGEPRMDTYVNSE